MFSTIIHSNALKEKVCLRGLMSLKVIAFLIFLTISTIVSPGFATSSIPDPQASVGLQVLVDEDYSKMPDSGWSNVEKNLKKLTIDPNRAFLEFGQRNKVSKKFQIPKEATSILVTFDFASFNSPDNETLTLSVNNTTIESFAFYVWSENVPPWFKYDPSIPKLTNVDSNGYPDKIGKAELNFTIENGQLYYTSPTGARIKVGDAFDGTFEFAFKSNLDESIDNESFGFNHFVIKANVKKGPSQETIELQDRFKTFRTDYDQLSTQFKDNSQKANDQFRDFNLRVGDLANALSKTSQENAKKYGDIDLKIIALEKQSADLKQKLEALEKGKNDLDKKATDMSNVIAALDQKLNQFSTEQEKKLKEQEEKIKKQANQIKEIIDSMPQVEFKPFPIPIYPPNNSREGMSNKTPLRRNYNERKRELPPAYEHQSYLYRNNDSFSNKRQEAGYGRSYPYQGSYTPRYYE